jgi:hypothetical protein
LYFQISNLPARRFLLQRLERLREALENLGRRVRENISELVGRHLGDTVREVIETLLRLPPSPRPPDYPPPRHPSYRNPYLHDDEPDDPCQDQGFWGDAAPMERDSLPPSPPPPETEAPEPVSKASRWRTLLAGLTQLAGWWLQGKPRRPALRRMLMVGTLVGITTVVAGPLVGGVLLTIGTALLLARVGDGSSQAVGRLPTVPAP